MKIGVIREIKDYEQRIGLTPSNCKELVSKRHKVFIERSAGIGARFSDANYIKAGATILDDAIEVAKNSDIIVKIKEPIKQEFDTWLPELRGKSLFTYLHLSANKELAEHLLKYNITGVSYDTIEDENGKLPLLKPMSEIAGRIAVDLAHTYKNPINEILIIGGGVVGEASVQQLINFYPNKKIRIVETNPRRAYELQNKFVNLPAERFFVLNSLKSKIDPDLNLKTADLIIGAVLVKGSKAPLVLSEKDFFQTKESSLLFDVAIDQGGCLYGSEPTTYSKPTYELFNRTYCCIPNLPGQRPKEASLALTKETFFHVFEMAQEGILRHFTKTSGWQKGINTFGGFIRNKTVATDLGMLDAYQEL